MTTYNKNYYTTYCASEDKTFIICELCKNDTYISVEVVGFHYGEPDKNSFDFIGKCKATFDFLED